MFGLQNYGNRWRLHRRVFHQSFNQDAISNYEPIQLASARRLLYTMMKSPKSLAKQIKL